MSAPPFRPLERISSRNILESQWCSLQADEVRLPDGSEGVHYLLHVPRAAVVLPLLDDGRIVMIRQWRYTLGKDHLELPAGRIHAGERPEEAAARELREETGYLASSLTPLPPFHPLMGISDHEAWPFLAHGLTPGTQELEVSEQIRVEPHTREELVEMLRTGEITDAFALVPLMRYLLFEPR